MRKLIIVLCLVLVPAAVALGAYWWTGSHALLPGLRGCAQIRETAPRGACVERELAARMEGVSVEQGLRRVDRLAVRDELVESHCHLAMHPIGERAGRRAARAETAPPPADADTNCRLGYLHGMLIGYMSQGDTPDDALATLCAREHQGQSGCAHVLGHLIARRAADDGPDDAVARDCRGADLAAGVIDECVRGGLMEIALMERQPPLGEWAALCRRAPGAIRGDCYSWLVAIAEYREQPRSAVQAACARLQPAEQRRACRAGITRGFDSPPTGVDLP